MPVLTLEVLIPPHPDGPDMAKVDADELVRLVIDQESVAAVHGEYDPDLDELTDAC